MDQQMIEIVLLDSSAIKEVQEIFFVSSSVKTFESEEKKTAFFKRWCKDYMDFYPNEFFIMRESDTKKVLGYLCGCINTQASLSQLDIPGLSIFQDSFEQYPAHLHINFTPECRGRGLGSMLVEYYAQVLIKKNIKGLHLITSPTALNVSFYRRLGFTNEDTRVFGKVPLLFMGKKLC
jgi:ribosomal protein S18 acetylase RimI-like enzyme